MTEDLAPLFLQVKVTFLLLNSSLNFSVYKQDKNRRVRSVMGIVTMNLRRSKKGSPMTKYINPNSAFALKTLNQRDLHQGRVS